MIRREEIAPSIRPEGIAAIVQDIEEAANGAEDVHHRETIETIDAEVDRPNAGATMINQGN